MKFETYTLRIGKITGVFYTRGKPKRTIVVWGKGAPSVPDNGGMMSASAVLAMGCDLFVFDYIGNGRSDGMFTPMNCIRSFLVLFDDFTRGCTGIEYYSMRKFRMRYKKVVLVGHSFGGRFLPQLHRFDKRIKEIGIFYSAMDTSLYGNLGKPEERIADFSRVMKNAGYHHIYRGILSKEWQRHWANKDSLAPVNCIKDLRDVKVFIAHGMLDNDINYVRSKEYFDRIAAMFPEKVGKTLVLKIYRKGDHGPQTAIPAVRDYLKWIGVGGRRRS